MTVTLAKMGRRKQNCPQKTGNNNNNNNAPLGSNSNNNVNDEGSEEPSMQEDTNTTAESGADSMSVHSEKDESRTNGSESLGNNSEVNLMPRGPLSPSAGPAATNDPLSIFKNPLFNPALLSLNPSLYAVQLAHLQAAQLLSQASSSNSSSSPPEEPSRKRKMGGDDGRSSKRPMSPKESLPLDLTKDQAKGPFSPGKMDPFAAAAALSPFFNPFLAASTASGGSTSDNSFVVKNSNNPLERMSEIVRGPGGASPNHYSASSGGNKGSSSSGGPRHSAWQSQWINRGPENSKDIFKCVWCKDAFSSLQDLTDHMKETKHFGPQIPSPPHPRIPPANVAKPHYAPPVSIPAPPPHVPQTSVPSSPKSRDILKEQLPMPRKLVRGQDVWLGRGEQQTRDILKCMWCGQSFRSLDLMTKHMQETKHYTKVISQEQLSSWKAGEPPSISGGPTPPANNLNSSSTLNNSVLTCKVCEASFSTLRDLSDHMVKNNHYVESPKGGTPSTAVSPSTPPPLNNAASSKEKRKKSLPVRKLLELERAQQEFIISGIKSEEGRITCEKCSEKIPVSLFASHIHLCVGSEQVRRPPSSSAASSSPPSISPSSSTPKNPPDFEAESTDKQQPKSILGSLEKMVQGNFGAGGKKKVALQVPSSEASLSILQRLGIDESIPSDFSRPMSGFLSGPKFMGTSSRSDSSECSSPDRKLVHQSSKDDDMKAEPLKSSLPPSPAPSVRSFQEFREEEGGTPNSLVDKQETHENEDPGRKKNPLAALQMLCDKTEKPKASSSSSPHRNNNNNSHGGGPSPLLPPGSSAPPMYSDPGAILAFSWACNQAIVNDSLLKCPFCDTPFISKGAYRHHLSKMHFVKDDKGLLPPGGGPKPGAGPEKSPSPNNAQLPPPSSPVAASSAKAENAQSKFQKYSQLAKQLSCSSQP